MKGFYIEITNNLLDSKHVKSMGSSIWEYMWLIDKMTRIDEDGTGWVLGGKPIKREEIKKDLGKDVGNIGDNLTKLEEAGYITLKRTPYGNIISINKAKKRYGKNAPTGKGTNATSLGDNATSGKGDNATNKEDITEETIQIDNTKENTTSQSSVLISEFINFFKEVNPSFKKLFGSPPQRKSSARLLELHGLEKLKKVVLLLPKTNTMQYMPTITTPTQLEDKWASLEANLRKKKDAEIIKKPKVAFT